LGLLGVMVTRVGCQGGTEPAGRHSDMIRP
jgi:hypothetical protein